MPFTLYLQNSANILQTQNQSVSCLKLMNVIFAKQNHHQ